MRRRCRHTQGRCIRSSSQIEARGRVRPAHRTNEAPRYPPRCSIGLAFDVRYGPHSGGLQYCHTALPCRRQGGRQYALDNSSSDRCRAARRNANGVGAIAVFIPMVRKGRLEDRSNILLLHQLCAVHDHIVGNWRILLPKSVLSRRPGGGAGAPTPFCELLQVGLRAAAGLHARHGRRRPSPPNAYATLPPAMTVPG
jgi:hypothetical protein